MSKFISSAVFERFGTKSAALAAVLFLVAGAVGVKGQAVNPPVHSFSITPSANQGEADWAGALGQERPPGTFVGRLLWPDATQAVTFRISPADQAEWPPTFGADPIRLLNENGLLFNAEDIITLDEFEITDGNVLRSATEFPEGPTIRRAVPVDAVAGDDNVLGQGWIIVVIERTPPRRPSLGDLQVFPVVGAPAGFDIVFNKQVDVFGLPIYASPAVTPEEVLHAANVWKQLLDTNGDGRADNPAVVATMLRSRAAILMLADIIDELAAFDAGIEVDELGRTSLYQKLYAEDLVMSKSLQDRGTGRLCGSIEASLVLTSKAGFAGRYPAIFGDLIAPRSTIQRLMDNARRGIWDLPPVQYSPAAWFTDYSVDKSYEQLVHEYFYWIVSTAMGAQDFPGRQSLVGDVWRPTSVSGLKRTDPWAYFVVNRTVSFGIPRTMPTNVYRERPIVAGERENARGSWRSILFPAGTQGRVAAPQGILGPR